MRWRSSRVCRELRIEIQLSKRDIDRIAGADQLAGVPRALDIVIGEIGGDRPKRHAGAINDGMGSID